MTKREKEDDEEKYDCTPGAPYEAFNAKLMNKAAAETDDRGWCEVLIRIR